MSLHHLGTRPCQETPACPEGFDHLFFMIDKFTKWIEAKPIAIGSSEAAVEFIKEVIYQYGVMNMTTLTMTPSSQGAHLSTSVMNNRST
jgi:hypothetical protein